MLKKTFCHVDGISITTEKILWEKEIVSWEVFLEKFESIDFLPQNQIEKIRSELFFSEENLRKKNLDYFRNKLVEKEHWRLLEFAKVAYVDIETTGLSKYSDIITMIGIYDGEEPHIYIKDINLEDAIGKLKEFDIIVTFNGKMFDIPFMEYQLREKIDTIHLDLRFMLKEFGLAGGLKNIERKLGINREEDVAQIDGREAVRLWRRYQKGDSHALELLKRYNQEDIVNLKKLLQFYLDKKTSSW